jgi:hypothetical protein
MGTRSVLFILLLMLLWAANSIVIKIVKFELNTYHRNTPEHELISICSK